MSDTVDPKASDASWHGSLDMSRSAQGPSLPRRLRSREGGTTESRLPTIAVALVGLVLLLADSGAATSRQGGRLLIAVEPRFCGQQPDCKNFFTVNGDGSHLRAFHFADPNGALTSGALSPAGDRIAYSARPTAVKVSSPDGSRARTIARFRSEAPSIGWSPDSRRLAAATFRQLWILSATARRSARRIVSVQGAAIEGLAWSPHGTLIAFQRVGRTSANPLVSIYVVRPDGSGLHRVVSPRLLNGFSWSPDDRRLIFSVYPNRNAFEKSTLYSVDVKTRISTSLGRGAGPLWAPRGQRIAFELPGHAGGWSHLCVSRADGRARKVLGKGRLLAWSPDGSRLAAVTPAGLVVMKPDGRGRRTIMRPPDSVLFVDWAR